MADNEAQSPPDPAPKAAPVAERDMCTPAVGAAPAVSKIPAPRNAPLATKSTLRIAPKLGTNMTSVSRDMEEAKRAATPGKLEAAKPATPTVPKAGPAVPTAANRPSTEPTKLTAPTTPTTVNSPVGPQNFTTPKPGAPNPASLIAPKPEPEKPSTPNLGPAKPVKPEPATPAVTKPELALPTNPTPDPAKPALDKPEAVKVGKIQSEEKDSGPSPAACPSKAVAVKPDDAVKLPRTSTVIRASENPAGPKPSPVQSAQVKPADAVEKVSMGSSLAPESAVSLGEYTAATETSPPVPITDATGDKSVTVCPTEMPSSLEAMASTKAEVKHDSAKVIKQEVVDVKPDISVPVKDEVKDEVKHEVKEEPAVHVPKQEPCDEDGSPVEISKASIRKRIWDYLEANNLANFPRPVHNRIPNFKGAAAAGDKAATLDVFKKAQTVKINPDKPQEQCRFLTLESHKNLLVPTPRLRQGLFNKINVPEGANKDMLKLCSTSQGIKEHSTPISLDSKVNIDLIIVGSVAVSRKGYRIGKGEGFADLEFGMMRVMEAVDENIVVVTTVHESQIEDIPDHLMQPHDLTVDFIVTPDDIFPCERRTKPTGIIWSMLTKEKLSRVPILKKLRERQREAGIDVTLKDGEEPEASESNQEEQERPRQRDRRRRRRNTRRRESEKGDGEKPEGEAREKSEHSGENGEEKDGRRREKRNTRRRRRRSSRKSEGEGEGEGDGGEGSEGDNGPESGADGDKENAGDDRRRRPQRRRKRRPTKSHDGDGHSGEEERKDRDADNVKPPRERTPRKRQTSGPLATVYVGALPRSLRVSEFKAQVRDKGINPLRVIWHGASGHAFLQFQKKDEADSALASLHEHEIDGNPIIVEMSKRGIRSGNQEDNAAGQENGDNIPADMKDVKKEAPALHGEE